MAPSLRSAHLLFSLCLLWAVGHVSEAQGQQKPVSFPLGSAGNLVIQPPDGMKQISPPAGSGSTVAFGSTDGTGAMLLLTPIPGGESDADAVKKTIDAGIRGARQQAVESSFPVTTLEGPQAKGGYFKATDKAPKAGEYRNLYQGAVAVGQVVVPFTILFNDAAERQAKAALNTVKGLRVQPKGGT